MTLLVGYWQIILVGLLLLNGGMVVWKVGIGLLAVRSTLLVVGNSLLVIYIERSGVW
jgi:hypothetical protein